VKRAALLLPLLVAGCAPPITPRPDASVVAPPADWRTALPAEGALEREWWGRFGDPQLSALVEQARANNTDLAIAAARVAEARAQERVARSLLLPSLSASLPGSESRTVNAFGQPSESSAAQPTFQAAYEVDLFGGNAARRDAARASAAAFAAAHEAATLSVSAATASGYITLLALDERLEVLKETLVQRGEALRIARDRAEAGYTSELELRQSEAEYRAAEQQIPTIEAAIARQENALSLLVGDTPHAITRGAAFDAIAAPAVPTVVPSELVRRRPDIAQAEYSLAATDANLRAARAQFLPQIRLSASAGAAISSLLGDPITIWSVGGSILAPIFSGGRIEGQFDAATAQRDQAAFAYRKSVLTAFREVEDQLALIDRLGVQEQALLAQRTAVAEVLRHATNRYRAGYSPYLEQIDAQRALLSVDLSLIQLRADRLNAYVALYQALGGGVSG
jgi:NodT family efflux transporter outer membrane factor (OMF) lipoprotein